MTDSHFLNQAVADQVVIDKLLKTIRVLTQKDKRMKLVKDEQGNVHQVVDSKPVTRQELEQRVADFQAALANAADDLAEYDKLAGAATTAEQPQLAQALPEQQTQPQVPAPQAPVENQPAPQVTVAEPGQVPAEPQNPAVQLQ